MLRRSIEGWGVRARLEAEDASALAAGLAALPEGFEGRAGKGSGPLFRVRRVGSALELARDGDALRKGRGRGGFARLLADEFETLAARSSDTFAFLHAGAVAIDGRAIVLPGRSFAGKSTLVAAFLRRGASYLSDDLVPIDRDLRAHPFPRALAVRSPEGRSVARMKARRLGARTADAALPLAMIWCGRYEAVVRRPSFARRTGTAAFAELLAHAPAAQIRPEVILPVLAAAAGRVPVYKGRRGDAEQMVDAVLRLLSSPRGSVS